MSYMKDSRGKRLDSFRSVSFDRVNLIPFQRGLDEGCLDLLHVGHSITEGTRSTTPGQRWTDVFRARIRSALGISGGGFGYIPAAATYPELLPAAWSFTGTTSVGTNSDGIGRYSRSMQASATASLVFTGTGIRIRYTAYNGGPTVTVTVDGTTVGTFSAQSSAADYAANAYFGGFTAGSHTVVISTPGALNLHGAMVYNGDDYAGVRSWNGGHSGDVAGSYSDGNGAARIPPVYGSIGPNLTTIEFLVNEYRTNVPADVAARNLAIVVDQVRSNAGNGAIVIMSDAQPIHDSTPYEPWSRYKLAAARVARVKNAVLFDMALLPGLGLSGSGMNADQVHPNPTGHATIGNALADLLLAA